MAFCKGASEQRIKQSASTTSDTGTSVDSDQHSLVETRICLIGNTCSHEDLNKNLQRINQLEVLVVDCLKKLNLRKYQRRIIQVSLNLTVVKSKDGHEYLDDNDSYHETIFVISDFESNVFHELKQTHIRILGPPVIIEAARTNKLLPYSSRPLYCTCMQGLNLCFTNFQTKDHLAHLVMLCHNMGASIRKEMTSKIDFLVTNTLHGPKYRTAVSLGTPVMKEEWVHQCWAARDRNTPYKATDEEFLKQYRSKPFEGCILSFLGFSDNERKHMEEQAVEQGSKICAVGDSACTHLVVDEHTVKSLPFVPEVRIYIVVQEWFWGSIQIEAKAAESMYIFEMVEYPKKLSKFSSTSSLLGTPRWKGSTNAMPTRASTGKTSYSFSRKRARLREETLAKLAKDSETDPSRPPCKRASTDTSACIPDSMLDISSTSNVKSPSELFTPHERSTRLKEKRQLRSFRKTVTKSYVDLELKSTTPSVLISHFKELAKGSPSRRSRSSKAAKCPASRKHTSHESSSSLGVTKRVRKSPSKGKSSQKNNRKSRVNTDISNSVSSAPCVSSPKVKIERKLTPCNNKQRRYSMFPQDIFQDTTAIRRRFSLAPTGKKQDQFESTCEEDSEADSDDTIVEDSELNRTFVDASAYFDNAFSENRDTLEENTFNGKKDSCIQEKVGSPKTVVSARYQVAMEFLQTEKNYVGILQTILNLFKEPLDDPSQAGGPILASEDVKLIFGSLPEMEVVHRSMRDDLEKVLKSWNESSCVGDLILKYAGEIKRCYPPFVNFFETSVETINRCDAKSTRFHAFLKINQAKKECGRQTLAELMINPVQRIPRIILLLQDIKKHTEKENSEHPDVKGIEACLDALKDVMTHINEDKRKTESHFQIFDNVNRIEGYPPTLVSSHRQFVARAEVIAVDDNLCKRGDDMCLFIFTDCLEIAKRKRKAKSNNSKSPTHNPSQSSVKLKHVPNRPPSNEKPFVHVKLMSLLNIKKVVDIKNSEDCENAFSFYCRTPTDTQDWLYTFKIISCSDDNTQLPSEDSAASNKENCNYKHQLLNLLARNRANALCKTNDENFVCEVDAHELDVSTSGLGSTLGRAVRFLRSSVFSTPTKSWEFLDEVSSPKTELNESEILNETFQAAKKSSRKLTRAFSFSRTPRRVVQRAVSNLLSPSMNRSQESLSKEDAGSSRTTLTPSMSVTSLCTPQRNKMPSRLPSTTSLQLIEESMDAQTSQSSADRLKSSVSTFNLARPQTAADLSDFPAIPTPPARKKKVGSSIKAATIALGRSGSFRKRKKLESVV